MSTTEDFPTAYQRREAIVKYADDHDITLTEASEHFGTLEFSDPDAAESLMQKHPPVPR